LIKCLEITIPADIKSFAEIAEAMDPDVRSLPLRARAEKVPELMERLYKDVNCKAKFGDWGMKESDIDRVTDLALTAYGYDMKLNPRQVTVEEVKEIYRQCI
jgi:alcohol dehydrogenase class IV